MLYRRMIGSALTSGKGGLYPDGNLLDFAFELGRTPAARCRRGFPMRGVISRDWD